MRVYLPNDSKRGGIGGGWTFRRNLAKAAATQPFTIVDTALKCDVALVCGATMVTRDTFKMLLDLPCKVVLRIDGIPEDHRNRGTGWPRLHDFAREADAVVFQSEFTRQTVGPLVGREGPVILNGCDMDIFTLDGPRMARFGSPSILCVNYRDDPNKRLEEVIVRFREYKMDNSGATLTFAGKFPTYLMQWGYGMLDFERDRDWRILGTVEELETMALIMRSHDFLAFPSFADPCPNTLIEALCCGREPLWVCDYGGAWEIVENFIVKPFDFWGLERMGREYAEMFEEAARK